MYIYVLLSILAITSVVECQDDIWNIIEDILDDNTADIIEDANLNVTELVNKYGCKIEEHTVTTEDGYILTLHRIQGKNETSNGIPVFLMHGILESSDSWVLLGPNKSLPYLLADEGFDVWMGNSRGNKHSLGHKSLDPVEREYWNFSWEETGLYDLPTMIDCILEKTSSESLYYIGHSQGTTSAYVLLSMKPEYNKKIKILFSLAPEAFLGNVQSSPIQLIAPTIDYLTFWLVDPLQPISNFYNKITPFLCKLLPFNCDSISFSFSGFDINVNKDIVPIIIGHRPAGASTMQFVHYAQLVNSKRFCRYNHGYLQNLDKYGQDVPPDYDLSKIIAPNVLFYSGNDWLSDIRDVHNLRKRLSNIIDCVYVDDFSHMDYQYGVNAPDKIYLPIIKQIKKFEMETNQRT